MDGEVTHGVCKGCEPKLRRRFGLAEKEETMRTHERTFQAMRWVAMLIWPVLAMLVLAGCGAGAITGPDTEPELTFRGATPQEEAAGTAIWGEMKQCVGAGRPTHLLVQVMDQPLFCNDVLAGGCTLGSARVNVARECYTGHGWDKVPCFEAAAEHEFIHVLLLRQGEPYDFGHTLPVWAKCDWRNRGGRPQGE